MDGIEVIPASKPLNVVTWPIPQLTRFYSQLLGLKPTAGQEGLPSLLDKLGRGVQAALKNLPSTVARENIVFDRLHYDGVVTSTLRQRYDYFVLAHTAGSITTLDEYRAVPNGVRDLADTSGAGFAPTRGFTEMWVVFSSVDQNRSDFRYLGRQHVDRQWTYVIAFRERPGEAVVSGDFANGTRSAELVFQGIAWISADDFHLVRLLTDLQSPYPEVGLDQLTTQITFGQVALATVPGPVWLPQEVVVTAVCKGSIFRNRHSYSDYRLFAVQSKILPAKP
jgi:hypothetical protein